MPRQAHFRQSNKSHIHNVVRRRLTYIIIDEVQLADDFVELLLSLMHQRNLEVFVSGSNSKFLSKDVVTEFRGRGQEIRVWPLSFKEYYSAIGGERRLAWQEYYVFGGLPQVLLLETEEEKVEEEEGYRFAKISEPVTNSKNNLLIIRILKFTRVAGSPKKSNL